MKSRLDLRLALDKADNIPRAKARQTDRSSTEAILEKSPDERYVVDDRCRGEQTLLAQILLELLRASLNRREPARSCSLGCNHPLVAQKLLKLTQCNRITRCVLLCRARHRTNWVQC